MRVFIIVMLLLSCFEVLANCKMSFKNDLESSYSMNVSKRRTIYFTGKLNRKKCNIQFVGIDRGRGTYTRRKLTNDTFSESYPFQLYNYPQLSIIKDLPEANNSNLLYPYEATGNDRSYQFRAVLSFPFRFLAAGRYYDDFTFNLYHKESEGSSAIVKAVQKVQFYYDLEEAIGVSLVRSGAPFDFFDRNLDLDFGTLKEGRQQGFDIVVLSNAGFDLSAYSLNDGVMTDSRGRNYVDYSMSFDGGPFRNLKGSLGSPIHIKSYSGVTPLPGIRINTSVRIDNVSNARAGEYSDTVVITAATIY